MFCETKQNTKCSHEHCYQKWQDDGEQRGNKRNSQPSNRELNVAVRIKNEA